MELIGRVQGLAARKYGEFTYRLAIPTEVSMLSIDPDGLNPLHEYPRFVSKPSEPHLSVVELADYVVKILPPENAGMHSVQVWMMPNQYTSSKIERLVCEFFAANAYVLRKECFDEALRRTFK